MKLLAVDDESKILNVIKSYAEKEAYVCDVAESGEEALKKVEYSEYDLYIVDLMMPVMDGYTLIKKIRGKSSAPIIVLSARGEEYDKLKGFDLGIDDYVTKPFSPKELMARIRAIMMRINPNDGQIIRFGRLSIDLSSRRATIDDAEIGLTQKEFDLLAYMAKNDNVCLSRESLLEKVWGYDFFGDDRTIDTHVKTLRSSLGDFRNVLETVRGVGYRFNSRNII